VDDEEHFDVSAISQMTWESYAQGQMMQQEMQTTEIPQAPIDQVMFSTVESAVPSIVPMQGYSEMALMQMFGGLPSANVMYPMQMMPYMNMLPPAGKVPVSAATEPIMRTQAATSTPQAQTAPSKLSQPTTEELLNQVKMIVLTGDLTTLTKKKVREQLSLLNPGLDMEARRVEINAMVDRVLSGNS
jgi:hypothetical protein